MSRQPQPVDAEHAEPGSLPHRAAVDAAVAGKHTQTDATTAQGATSVQADVRRGGIENVASYRRDPGSKGDRLRQRF